ncbi:hypothetical protein XA68_15776 [Ophiocordyceps unilateralis]|uniref:Nuclear speckle splicing regulatory protein 1 N-terminal domain-containing protein n=1 Tax=Ophiocordyceps unilateralis TaxID=268505 RepID=A0A2A9P643_OPHUN|nr:hypothetical protein XA68_15776 [Ophiocordyceps unilateralis]
MSRPGFAFGLNKKQASTNPTPRSRNAVFGGDDDSDDDGARGQVEAIGGELDLQTTAKEKSKSKSAAAMQPPKLKAKSRTSPMFGDLSSSLTSRKNAEAAQEVDPTVYEYDSVYDSLKKTKSGAREEEAGAERKPKYMQSLMRAAQVRKQDALIAEEKKIAREREAEGDEFADKEKFVTEAYKKQQEENRRLEEEERRMEEEDAKRNKGGGMSAFYRRLLDKDEERHAQAVKAVQERASTRLDDEPEAEKDKERDEAALARELNEKGASVAVNEDGQVVDKRQLLKGGLNVGTKKREASQREAGGSGQARPTGTRPGARPNDRQAMRERQSRMVEEQREQSLKRSRDVQDASRLEAELAAKSRKTEGEISGARERYLARKRAAEEGKGKDRGAGE